MFLQRLQVLQRELPSLQQARHDWLAGPPKESEKVVDDAPVNRGAGDEGFEEERIPDLSGATNRSLFLEAGEDRLHRRVGWPLSFLNGLLHLTDRGFAELPENLHDLELELTETDRTLPGHRLLLNDPEEILRM